MNAHPAPHPEARRIRLFLLTHLFVLAGFGAAALIAGGGVRGLAAPFDPDLPQTVQGQRG